MTTTIIIIAMSFLVILKLRLFKWSNLKYEYTPP